LAKYKVQITLQGVNIPWQKERVSTLTKVFVLQLKTKVSAKLWQTEHCGSTV